MINMMIAFILTMPNVTSWNGKWSGEDRLWCRVKSFKKEIAEKILSKKYYGYRWSDGWRASITVKQVDKNEARRLTRASSGFYGYDWMIDTIVKHGKILNSDEVKELLNDSQRIDRSIEV